MSDACKVVDANRFIFCFQVTIQGEWVLWQSKVPQIEVETHKVAAPDVVVPTVDTVRHEALLYTWLAEHKPMVLCGPPGSGKTMTLFSALRALPDMEVCDFKGGRDQFSFIWLPSKTIQYMTHRTLPLYKKFILQGTGSKCSRRKLDGCKGTSFQTNV